MGETKSFWIMFWKFSKKEPILVTQQSAREMIWLIFRHPSLEYKTILSKKLRGYPIQWTQGCFHQLQEQQQLLDLLFSILPYKHRFNHFRTLLNNVFLGQYLNQIIVIFFNLKAEDKHSLFLQTLNHFYKLILVTNPIV